MPTHATAIDSVVSATGWTNATPSVLNAGGTDNFRATDGHPGEQIIAEITDAPADFGLGTTATFAAEWRVQGTVNRQKNLLLELVSPGGTVYASYATPASGAIASDRVDQSSALAISGTLDAAAMTAARLRVTVQEGSGMVDTATVEIDAVQVVVEYNVAVTTFQGTATDAARGADASATIFRAPLAAADAALAADAAVGTLAEPPPAEPQVSVVVLRTAGFEV